ncbi:unnamed protein product [Prorocentrum cordatum]|uniref:Uncharacterized protein n=1 Tax=Prorocentrum cordatum TaxID=2364126 RepID=A0ABN9TBN2_9DINO|nr:unnamed protein product [Polarella glacialis]
MDAPPASWPRLEAAALQSLCRGPSRWAPPSALHGLPLMGFPAGLPDLPSVALAAKARVCQWEAAAEGGLRVEAFVLQLEAARVHFEERNLRPRQIAAATGAADVAAQKRVWQRTCVRLIAPSAAEGLRNFLHWRFTQRCSGLCGMTVQEMADRALATYPAVSRAVPPRVFAACLRSLWNGWITARRFQGHAACVFGCAGGEDSIEHYSECRWVAAAAATHFGLARPATRHSRLARFVLLEPAWSAAAAGELQRRARLTCSVYLTHCWTRHAGACPPEACRSALRQKARELS